MVEFLTSAQNIDRASPNVKTPPHHRCDTISTGHHDLTSVPKNASRTQHFPKRESWGLRTVTWLHRLADIGHIPTRMQRPSCGGPSFGVWGTLVSTIIRASLAQEQRTCLRGGVMVLNCKSCAKGRKRVTLGA